MSDWLVGLQQRAAQAPLHPRALLQPAAGASEIGSIEPALAQRLAEAGLPLRAQGQAWVVVGTPEESLALIARWLHDQGLASRWRNELLSVSDATGRTVARVERAAARPLGITTHAVHLVGRSAEGGYWVQQRALDKSTDPGLWDTLMGGLVSAGESIDETLERESWEEAGLRLDQLEALAPRGEVWVRRPVREGYMVERLVLFEARLREGVQPVNQDGEVARFEHIDRATLIERLRAEAFTLEAALVLAQTLAEGS